MANLLRNCEDFAVPYLDDTAIFSLAWDDHLKHLKDVFDRLRSAKLHIKPSKCQFAQAYVKYLGHLVGQVLRTPGELKVQVIKDFPIPTNKTQVRAVLGLSGYYRIYIPEFSVITAPLTNLLKGRNRKSTVDWNSSCQNAFEELKTRLSKNPVLYSPDFIKPFIIQCDASNLGIGVVLSQAGGNIGPYFFKNDERHNVTVNGDRYRAMITYFFIPELNNHDVQELWFQQDGATCHTARATIDLLKNTFGDRLISRFGPVNWPPRSCDLTPLDYFLWGYVK
ncbi:retrovirus-related Pol polyprotein from transposon 297 [Trichonephila clavipes]|nr:retrovirus-related Pol polyprotein from transposon 297 [Trichonephila clavipes]